MLDNEGKTFFDKKEKGYMRFTKRELLEQKRELIFYIINKLTKPDVASIQESVDEIRALTGFELSLEEAMQLKRFAYLTSSEKENKSGMSK